MCPLLPVSAGLRTCAIACLSMRFCCALLQRRPSTRHHPGVRVCKGRAGCARAKPRGESRPWPPVSAPSSPSPCNRIGHSYSPLSTGPVHAWRMTMPPTLRPPLLLRIPSLVVFLPASLPSFPLPDFISLSLADPFLSTPTTASLVALHLTHTHTHTHIYKPHCPLPTPPLCSVPSLVAPTLTPTRQHHYLSHNTRIPSCRRTSFT